MARMSVCHNLHPLLLRHANPTSRKELGLGPRSLRRPRTDSHTEFSRTAISTERCLIDMTTVSTLSPEARDLLFREARTQNAWRDEPVSEVKLRELHDLMKWAPTSANSWPLRIVFVCSKEEKERLAETAMESNAKKIREAPVTAVLAHDLEFYEKMDRLFPHDPGMKEMFAEDEDLAQTTAFRNGTLQGAYFILAARSIGLDCGPMSGFDNDAVDELYFEGTSLRSNFLCSIGHGDPEGVYDRSPRPDFDEVHRIV